ncbi:hypothetical protein I549_0177 [Mycobacterium avium subsp. avium 2285 (R)]|nr:hypothetical protein I549_0177 [Mycobacterium avium subsp. avium 2285 (R)]
MTSELMAMARAERADLAEFLATLGRGIGRRPACAAGGA